MTVIDAHNHLGHRKGEEYEAADMLTQMDQAGIDRAVITTHPEAIDNEYIAGVCRAHPDRFYGFAVINPWNWNATEELVRSIEELRLVGLKLNPMRHGFSIDRHELMDPIYEYCAETSIPVLIHGGSDLFNMPSKFEEVAARHPSLVLVLAHMGLPHATHAAFRAAIRFPNLYLDTASVDRQTLSRAIEAVGPEKILMATDASWGSFALSMSTVDTATDDQSARSMIKGGNILRILQHQSMAPS